MVIGDGHLQVKKTHKNAILIVGHSIKQREYCLWKKSLIENTGMVAHYYEYEATTNPFTEKKGIFSVFYTRAYSELTGLRNLMYPKDKGFRPGVLDDLAPLHLAIIFQDDGGKVMCKTVRYGKKSVPLVEPYIASYRIALQSHGNKGVSQFCEWMGQRFGITAKPLLVPSGYTVAIYRKADKAKFRDLIRSYVHPTMMYKLEGTFEAHVIHRERLSERGFENNRIMQQSALHTNYEGAEVTTRVATPYSALVPVARI